ncbi:sialate O-acetylesterase [Pedobacter helvus]|uniref:Sialate O-acetylesterase n=1 Tax=Pedobacter helvus TaxID=2563444 RepID=A0ABW9JEX8_9SPHI|nr:sialate O-acetylesterase [Pedobacter ureilyticus]
MKAIKYLLLLCLLAVCKPCFSVLKLADALQSNMVVQQNKAFRVWGTATAGHKVSVLADWLANPTTVVADKNGEFLALIDVPLAKAGDFTTHQILVQTQDEKLSLTNLLIGDIWFCSGQSNMQFSVKEMIGANEVLSSANQPHIRLLSVGLNFSATPIGNFSGKWQESTSDNVKDFSAVGYTFGKKLYDELNIPIGLIFSGIGASGVQAFVPQEKLQNNKLLNETYLKPYLASPKAKEKIDAGFSFEKVVRPFLLYNALINPFTNLSIKGFCWYQGEANHMERESYVTATQTLIKSWRTNFKQGDLPFYYVQIAPYFHEKEDDKLAYDAFFREAQAKVATLNNTAMVSTIDVGEAKDLHPKNKKPVGLRLAAVALNRTYSKQNLVDQGPEYNYVTFKKNVATIHFKAESLGSGLNTNDGNAPRFFYMAGEDQVFHLADAVIEGNTVVVSSKKVKKPVALRYAFFNYPVTNLQNREGFPVLPFRTDHWAEIK